MKGHQISFQGESQQPTKKIKHSASSSNGFGGVMNRFFNSAANGYRVGRPAAQQIAT
jgi:hypothetical protein